MSRVRAPSVTPFFFKINSSKNLSDENKTRVLRGFELIFSRLLLPEVTRCYVSWLFLATVWLRFKSACIRDLFRVRVTFVEVVQTRYAKDLNAKETMYGRDAG